MSLRSLRPRYCPDCGHENPGAARFCMDCGHSLAGESRVVSAGGPAAALRSEDGSLDWAAVMAAGLALLGLGYASRKARQWGCLILFFLLFFGGPMACGVIMFLAEAVTSLFQ